MPTSARWAITNSPKILVKTVCTARADVGIGPYIAGAGAPLGALLLLRFQLLDDLNNAAGAKARGAEFDKFFRILKR